MLLYKDLQSNYINEQCKIRLLHLHDVINISMFTEILKVNTEPALVIGHSQVGSLTISGCKKDFATVYGMVAIYEAARISGEMSKVCM